MKSIFTPHWKNPYISVIITCVLAAISIFLHYLLTDKSSDEKEEKYYNELLQLLLRVAIFLPIVVHTLFIAFDNNKISTTSLNLNENNFSYFKGLSNFLNNIKQTDDRNSILKEIIGILKTVEEKGSTEMKIIRKYYDMFLFNLQFNIKEFHENLKNNHDGTVFFRSSNPERLRRVWEKGIECVREDFFATNYPINGHSFGRKDDSAILELQRKKVIEVKDCKSGKFKRVFIYDCIDADDLKRLYNTLVKQDEFGIEVKLIEKTVFLTTFKDYIQVIGSPDFCLINNKFLLIMKLSSKEEKKEYEMTYESHKILASQNIRKFLLESELCKQFTIEKFQNMNEFVSNFYVSPVEEKVESSTQIQKDIFEVENIISEGNIDKAIQELMKLTEETDIEIQIRQQSAKWNSAQQDRRIGVLSIDDVVRIRSDVIWCLLELTRDIKKKGK